MKTIWSTLCYLVCSLVVLFKIGCDDSTGNTDDTPTAISTFWKTIGTTYNEFGYISVPTQDSGFVIVGSTDYPSQGVESFVYIVKTNSQGDTLWTRYYNYQTDEEGFKSIQELSSGGFIIAFTSYYNTLPITGWLLRIDNSGNLIWAKSLPSTARVAREVSDGFIVVGQQSLMKTNSTGDTVWTRSVGGRDIKPTRDGGFIIAGNQLIKTDSNGTVAWSKNYNGNSVVELDSGYAVIGSALTLTNINGDSTWSRAIGGESIDVVSDGLVLCGFSSTLSIYNFITLEKVSFAGNTMWTRQFSGPIYVLAYSVTGLPDHGILVGGQTANGNGYDLLLFKTNDVGIIDSTLAKAPTVR